MSSSSGTPSSSTRHGRGSQQLEQRWSRFLPTSELSRLNASAGREVSVSADTLTLLRACATAWAATDGRFDPTLRHAMVALGYDRDFALVAAGPMRHSETGPSSPRRRGMAGVVIDERASTVRLPHGVGLDAGGLGKGLAADIVVAELEERGAHGAMVNLGGDLAVAGEPPDGEAWVVGVEDPHAAERTLCRVAIVQGWHRHVERPRPTLDSGRPRCPPPARPDHGTPDDRPARGRDRRRRPGVVGRVPDQVTRRRWRNGPTARRICARGRR